MKWWTEELKVEETRKRYAEVNRQLANEKGTNNIEIRADKMKWSLANLAVRTVGGWYKDKRVDKGWNITPGLYE